MQGTGELGAFVGLIAIVAAGLALAAALHHAPRWGLLDHPDHRKRHVGAVPLVGGISAMAGLLAGAACVDARDSFDWFLLGTAVALVAVGVMDDRRNLRVLTRVAAQSVLILTVMLVTGVHIDSLGELFGHQANLGWLGTPFTLVAMLGLLNAFNLIDGIDGLASLLAWVAVAGILLTTGGVSRHGTSMLLVVMAVALLPQLAGNLGLFGSRGRCFLGSAGSTLLGYVLGWSLIVLSQTQGSRLSPVGTLWCVAIPVLDTLSVMYRRVRAHKSPFKPGRKHIHYLLMDSGLGARATLAVIVTMAAVIWCLGATVRLLHLGAGSNLAAFCVVLVLYTYGTRKLERWIGTHAGREGSATTFVRKLADAPADAVDPGQTLAPIANDSRGR